MPYIDTPEQHDFLSDIQARRGGAQIGYKTFSTFYADTDGNICDRGVFFYECEGRFWFEDFENEPTFLGFKLPIKRFEQKYEKFESSFSPADVTSIRKVVKASARRCARGESSIERLRTANPVLSFFRETVYEFRLADGKVLFFSLIDKTVPNMIIDSRKRN